VQVSFKTPAHNTDWPSLRHMWREADAIPVYQAGWTFDHLYPWRSDPTGPCLEGWTLLAALAVETRRLRLGAMVTSNVYRHPALLAKMAATLDIVSDGRLELGLGAGGDETEARAFGLALPSMAERIEQLGEACQVFRMLFGQAEASFDGHYYRLRNARCEPKPVQRPAPPVVIGGRGERLLRVAARWADGWNFPGGPPDELRRALDKLRGFCGELGRDASEISVSAQLTVNREPAVVADAGAELIAAGADHLVLVFEPPFRPGRLAAVADAIDALA
jgi:F420-dependent oxidoreductase-like protein